MIRRSCATTSTSDGPTNIALAYRMHLQRFPAEEMGHMGASEPPQWLVSLSEVIPHRITVFVTGLLRCLYSI